jgi:hypothetical protein
MLLGFAVTWVAASLCRDVTEGLVGPFEQFRKGFTMSSAERNALRAKVLNNKPTHKIVELDDGTKIEVRQTTVGQMLDAVSEENTKKRMATVLIESCYVPGTDEKVFEDADFEVLMGMPSGGVYQKLMDAINARDLPESMEAAKKT